MRILIACEFSGVVRDAFIARGHDAWSCDLLPCERSDEHHWQGNVLEMVHQLPGQRWDLMIAFPPCTHLSSSGARWFSGKIADGRQQAAVQFVRDLMAAPIDRIAIENPIGILSTVIQIPDQIIHPWQHGHGETKATCLWLKNLPLLKPSNIVEGRAPRVHHASPGPNRWKERSRTLEGVAKAMAEQWGGLLTSQNSSATSPQRVSASGVSAVNGACIVCGSGMLMQFWRGHPGNQRIHCNDCGSEVTPRMHSRKQSINAK